MKKIYTKPYIATESFQLDAAIASSCTSDNKQSLGYAVNTCTLNDDKGIYLPTANVLGLACAADGVDIVNAGSDGNDGYCYHGPVVDVTTIFMNS